LQRDGAEHFGGFTIGIRIETPRDRPTKSLTASRGWTGGVVFAALQNVTAAASVIATGENRIRANAQR